MNFSILISIYTNESPEYFHDSISSIYNSIKKTQSEIIIIKDGPLTHQLEDILDKWKKILSSKLKIIALKNNVGLGFALNEGLKHCTYDWIFRMDTDDICLPNRFEKQIEFIKHNPDISLLGSSTEEFDEKMENSFGYRINPIEHNDIVNYAKKRNPFNHMTVAFKKEAVLAVGGYQHHLFMEDYNLWIRMISSGYKVANLPDILVKVRAGNSMVTRRKGLKYIKSEYKLANLKIKTNLDNSFSAYSIFLLRSVPRMLPTSFLSKIYKMLRK
ncbi:glycosyltransferase [Proteus terrae]|uniref:glycosyltransferase n=1 Tax=Proteus terrae TaxID=1574161 RepID=UPI001C5DD442|nr:glycosyltransferase [Proteus terrae]